jgi:GIY-YIG catalytic domain
MITIYALECALTTEAYIGCTKGKIGKRMREHRCLLKAGKHSAKLQQLWNQHSSEFQMKPIETLPKTASIIEKRERELYWLRFYDDRGLLLNASCEASFRPTKEAAAKGVEASRHIPRIQTPEANAKRRIAQLGKPKGHGAKISATKQAKNRLRDSLSYVEKKDVEMQDKEPAC